MKKNRDLDIGSWPDIVRKMYLTMKICVCMENIKPVDPLL